VRVSNVRPGGEPGPGSPARAAGREGIGPSSWCLGDHRPGGSGGGQPLQRGVIDRRRL